MVQKSGVHQLRLVVYPIIDKVLAPSQVVVRISPFSDLMCFFVPISSSYFPLASWMGTHPWRTWKKTMHTVYKYSRKKARSGPRKHREICWDVGVISISWPNSLPTFGPWINLWYTIDSSPNRTHITNLILNTIFGPWITLFHQRIHLQNHLFEVTSSADLFFPHLQAPMHGSLCFSSWGGLFFHVKMGGVVFTKKGICTWYSKQSWI